MRTADGLVVGRFEGDELRNVALFSGEFGGIMILVTLILLIVEKMKLLEDRQLIS